MPDILERCATIPLVRQPTNPGYKTMTTDPTLSITRQRGEPVDRNRGGRFVSKRELRQAQAEAVLQSVFGRIRGAQAYGFGLVLEEKSRCEAAEKAAARLIATETERPYRAEVEGEKRRAKAKNQQQQGHAAEVAKWFD